MYLYIYLLILSIHLSTYLSTYVSIYLSLSIYQVGLSTKKNEAIISVNSIAMITTRIMTIRTGAYYYIGNKGGPELTTI